MSKIPLLIIDKKGRTVLSKKTKRIRRLKKNHPLLAIIVFLLVQAVAVVVMVIFSEFFLEYMVDSKANEEIKLATYIARIYDLAIKDGKEEEAYYAIESFGRDYLIRDKEGNIIKQKGEVTIDGQRKKLDGILEFSDSSGVVSFDASFDEEDRERLKNELEESISETAAELENEGIDLKTEASFKEDVLKEDGTDTISESEKDIKKKEKSGLSLGYGDVYIYKDSVNGYIYVEDGAIAADVKTIFKILFMSDDEDLEVLGDDDFYDAESGYRLGAALRNGDMGLFGLTHNAVIHFPFWVSLDVNNGDNELIYKSYVDMALVDFGILIMFIVVMVVISFIVFIIMIINIISNAVSQRKTVTLLFTDMVTGGHNWMWFLYKGEQLLRRRVNAKNSYAIVNLVFVKYRNYCVCHSIEQGEKMLKKVYSHLNRSIDKKEMVAHVSNSNFALLLKYDDIDRLKMRLQSLVLELEKIDDDHVFSFQVGVDPIPPSENDKGKIVRRNNIDVEIEYNNACTARATLAENDESGVAIFDEKLIEDQKWIDKVTERQRYALENEEFVVYYQPKYDPTNDQLRGAEALVRWVNDDMGFVPPGKFIPIFEKNGFITEIDHYMLEHVARDQKAWLDKGYKCVPVSVNVSRAHFIESDLAEQIRDTVDKFGTPHQYVEIELTESAFFDDKKALISTITRLKEYGFAVSMDDFGSGYSSLNSLKDMPLDVLKLDAEFFRGDNQGERGEIVVSEAIKLAKSLNMRTVAEGVEVREQVDFLAKQGCDMIQGYIYAKPMPGDEYEQRMQN